MITRKLPIDKYARSRKNFNRMGKLLRPSEILLLFLAGGIDAFIDFKNEPMATACKNLYGWVPPRYQKTNYFQTIYYSLRTGYIEKVIKGGEVYLRLTPKGKEKASRDFSLSSWQKRKWDRKWRIVIFDIAEVNKRTRDRFRAKLKELGFGMLQESVWITPYDFASDMAEFIESQGLEENAFVLETSSLLAGEEKNMAAKIWPLSEINARYMELFLLLKKLRGRGEISIGELRKVRSEYLEILRDDPCLPKELLPKDWYRDKVEEEILRFK